MKYVVLSMDIEDWYHLDYFARDECDLSYSMLDGIECYLNLLKLNNVPSTFFILSELCKKFSSSLLKALNNGVHEIASHGCSHTRPLMMDAEAFCNDIKKSKHTIEDAFHCRVKGYRAPCFSLDRKYLDLVCDAGYLYDSSRILFKNHPLYGSINLDGFTRLSNNIYKNDDFFEFQVSTLQILGRNVPVSGGGYLRIFPWLIFKSLVRKYIKDCDVYVLYIHPFELSKKVSPILPKNTKLSQRFRFNRGRRSVENKLNSLIKILKSNDFHFTTFEKLRDSLLF